MCMSKKIQLPPEPEAIPAPPPIVTTKATTQKVAPVTAKSASYTAAKKRRGRGSLRIPLTSFGGGTGVQFPTN